MDLYSKRFIQLTSIIFAMFAFLIIGLLGIYNWVSIEFYQISFVIFILIVIAIASIFIFVALTLIMTYKRKKLIFIKPKQILSLIRMSYPLMKWTLGAFRIPKQSIIRFFIEINNIAILSMKLKVSPLDILILTPHCLQKSSCSIKVTADPTLCKRCGGCKIQDLLELKKKYGVHIAIATGGTLARKVIKQHKPKLIVAVACERDLISGIMDIPNIPVVGVLNQCPNGPCINTTVNTKMIEQSIIPFI